MATYSPEEILRKYWHYDSFRPMQHDVIDAVLSGFDALALMPTGGGKSLCYQVPALCQEGVCLVVSPLVALMRDQVAQLRRRGIAAAFLSAGMHPREIEVVLNQCVHGRVKLLYIAPERIQNRLFLDHFRQMNLSLIAVDEAHCISEWGYDFRPSFRQLAQLRALHPRVPLLALTASATPPVVSDIMHQLHMEKGRLFRAPFLRPNLTYVVRRAENPLQQLLQVVEALKGSGIVYVGSRHKAEEVCAWLRRRGAKALFYHAGMNRKERDLSQRAWTQAADTVMVATSAFGMGIDKADVRYVVHLHVPASLEAYYQESGRAGRDGQQAYAVLVYNDDILRQTCERLNDAYPPLTVVRNVYHAICNSYGIPVGGGEGERRDINIVAFCRSYQFSVGIFFAAMRYLEAEGLLSLSEQEELVSQIFIPVRRDTIYRLAVESMRFGPVIDQLMRTGTGIFTRFTDIDEAALARQCGGTKESVRKSLQTLDQQGWICYKPASLQPQVHFLAPRRASHDVTLDATTYRRAKENALQRFDIMMRYLHNTTDCRSRMLVAYFGEADTAVCGKCDNCRRFLEP